ncbi:MAG: hypothetical protein PW788_06940 [Micavibrio sp.]|nr:hypothetical protein [Micavibrio sp.]
MKVEKGQDRFLIFFGSYFSDKTLRYGRVDQTRLPNDARRLLGTYKELLIAFSAVVILLLLRMQFWSLAFGLPLIFGAWVMKGHFETRLDPMLEPYMPKRPDKANDNPDDKNGR